MEKLKINIKSRAFSAIQKTKKTKVRKFSTKWKTQKILKNSVYAPKNERYHTSDSESCKLVYLTPFSILTRAYMCITSSCFINKSSAILPIRWSGWRVITCSIPYLYACLTFLAASTPFIPFWPTAINYGFETQDKTGMMHLHYDSYSENGIVTSPVV